MPAGFLFPLGAVLALVAGLGFLWLRKRPQALVGPLLLAATGFAFLYTLAYQQVFVRPVQALAGQTQTVTARVEDSRPGYGEERYTLNLTVLTLAGQTPKAPIKLQVYDLPPAAIGEVLRLELSFRPLAGRDDIAYNHAKGIYINAQAQIVETIGEQTTFLGQMRRLKYVAAENIGARLPRRLASVAAAMALGDRRNLSSATTEAYRMAGLSHMLVVSGLHLSILTGAVYAFCRAVLRRKRLVAVFSMAAVFLFMAFTGLTPSILRSGIACLLVYGAVLFGRKADVYTSLGLAGLLLCLQNPFAATDAGLQLSFTATLGTLLGAQCAAKLGRHFGDGPLAFWQKALLRLGQLAAVPSCVTLATLPVVALNSFGFSLLALPMNLLAVPLLSPILLCGFALALPTGLPVLEFFLRPFALLGGWLLHLLELLTGFAASLPGLYITVGGLFFFTAILLAYLLLWLALRTPYRKTYAVAAALTLPLALALHFYLDKDTVRIGLVGSGPGAAVVVSQGGKGVVLYRSRLAANEAERVFARQNLRQCVLFLDMRQNPQSTEYVALFRPEAVYAPAEELRYREIFSPLPDVQVYLQAQGEGQIACLDIEGYKLALVAGGADLRAYPAVDVLIPSNGAVEGEYGLLFTASATPEWADAQKEVLYSEGNAQLCIRPGKSVIYRESDHDIFA